MRTLILVLFVAQSSWAQYTIPMHTGAIAVTGGTATTPSFSPSAGAVSNPTTVSLSAGSCGSYIYWGTTNPPTTSDTHSTSISVTGAATYYAKVIGCPSYTDSAVGSAAYTIAGSGVTDNFAGSGALSANWTNTLSHNIALNGSGYAHGATVWYGAVARYTGASFTNDQYAEVTVGAVTTETDTGVMVRVQANGDGYRLGLPTAGVNVSRYGTGGAVLLNNSQCSNVIPSSGDIFRLTVVGTVLTAYKNGSAIAGCTYDTAPDGAKFSTGMPGMAIGRGNSGADPTFDAFAAGNM